MRPGSLGKQHARLMLTKPHWKQLRGKEGQLGGQFDSACEM